MPVSIFLGRERVARIETTAPDGTTSATVLTFEPEWSESDREAAYALYQDKLERCPDCGRPMTECADPANAAAYPQRRICWTEAAKQVALRKWSHITDDAHPDAAGFLPGDGVTLWMAQDDLTPNDDFLAPRRPVTAGDFHDDQMGGD